MQAFAIIGFVFGISALSLASTTANTLKKLQADITTLKAAVEELRARLR